MNRSSLFARRLLLLGIASLFAACGKGGGVPSAAVEISKDTACTLDGMLLADYPGPKAQIRYAGQAAPDFFCDTTEMLAMVLKPEQARKIEALYVQDMGKTAWDAPQGAWIDARSAYYVVGSKKRGAMGPTLPSFGSAADAQKFAAADGGKVVPFAQITPDMVRLDGGALHDQRM